MLFNVACELEYAAKFPSTLILNIQAQRNSSQTILSEQLTVTPRLPVSEFAVEHNGSRFLRLETGRHKSVAISYAASVDCDVHRRSVPA